MLDAALCASTFLMGLAGGPHCVAMCGAAQAGLSAPGGVRSVVALQLGRVAGYSAAGALIAASVSTLSAWSVAAPLLRPLWQMLHVAAIALGLWLLWHGAVPDWLARFGDRARNVQGGVSDAARGGAQPLRFVRRVPAPIGAAAAGVCWAAMPCGLLQSALLVAALASAPSWGAGAMASFAIGTTASLGAIAALWAVPATAGPGRSIAALAGFVRPTLALRVGGAMLFVSSAYALLHGMSAEIGAICGSLFSG